MTAEARAEPPGAGETVWGWKGIAGVLGRSVDTAQRLAARNEDPLPVFWEHDRHGAYVQAILHWRARQRCSFKIHRELTELRAVVRRGRRPAVPRRESSAEAAE